MLALACLLAGIWTGMFISFLATREFYKDQKNKTPE